MDSVFNYGSPVSGKHFLGRKKDVNILTNLITQKENIVLISPPKGGKTSLIQQAFLQLRLGTKKVMAADLDLRDVRDRITFLRRFGDTVIRQFATTPAEIRAVISRFLAGTHFIFDPRSFSEDGCALSLNWDPDAKDLHALLTLPYILSRDQDRRLILILREFQNVRFQEDWELLLKTMETVVKEQRSLLEAPLFSYIMTGSQVNAMKDIFEHWRWFHRLAVIHYPSQVDENEFT